MYAYKYSLLLLFKKQNEELVEEKYYNNEVIRSIELFQIVQNYVINNADQTPNHSLIHGTGHDGGEFLFFPRILLR